MRMINKRGSAHFEMIISFTFFAGFIFFLFVVLEPQDTRVLPDSVIAGLYDSFRNEVSTNLSSVFLKANYEVGDPSCFMLDLPDNVFNYPFNNDGSRVFDLAGNPIDSNLDGGSLYVDNDSVYFNIMFSSEFEDGGVMSGCGYLVNYELGGILERRVFSYDALATMTVDYFSDLDSLKSRLKVPSIFDFAIVFNEYSELSMEPAGDSSGVEQIVAKEYIVEVLKKNGDIINERIVVKVW